MLSIKRRVKLLMYFWYYYNNTTKSFETFDSKIFF